MIQHHNNGLIQFSDKPLTVRFSDLFDVRVGFVAKSKKLATDGNVPCVSSKSHEGVLAMYDFENTEWIRKPVETNLTNLFCLCKTRAKNPFFGTGEKYLYDGAVLGLYPKEKCKELFTKPSDVVEWLNGQHWLNFGFKSPDGRFQFSQRSLSNCLLAE